MPLLDLFYFGEGEVLLEEKGEGQEPDKITTTKDVASIEVAALGEYSLEYRIFGRCYEDGHREAEDAKPRVLLLAELTEAQRGGGHSVVAKRRNWGERIVI